MIILGISAYFHDSSATILVDGEIIAAVQEERFNRIKNSEIFPRKSIEYCLKEANVTLEQVDQIIFFEKPFLKFERLLETYYVNAPKGLFSFLKAMPQWTGKKLFLRREIKRELRSIDPSYKKQKKILFSSHHLSHAASAYYPSPYEDAAILIIDAVGEWATTTIASGKGNSISLIKEMRFPHSVGLLYSSFTYFLGFKVNSGEYKLMGLAPYGNADDDETRSFITIIRSKLITIFDDGSIEMNRSFFRYETGLKMVRDSQWEQLFGFKKRNEKDTINQSHCNLAFAIQTVTEEIILKLAEYTKLMTGSKNLCLAGGVALNCVANGKLAQSNLFDSIWVQPGAGDTGGSLGAALALYYSNSSPNKPTIDSMQGSFLGPAITDHQVEEYCQKENIHFSKLDDADLYPCITSKVKEGKVIGWVQGRMEFGPRALGARSIIADPSHPEMQKKLNLSIKFREDFRPFAPVMLAEEAKQYFGCDYDASYMQFVEKLLPKYRLSLPENYSGFALKEKLDVPRSKFQAITHVDFSSRLQVVKDQQHPLFRLLREMRNRTGDGMLINTSYNRNGEPIVCTINDAYDCFKSTDIDILVVNNYFFTK